MIEEIHQMVQEMKQKEEDKDDDLGNEEENLEQEAQNVNIAQLVMNMSNNHAEVSNKLKSIVKKINKLQQGNETARF